MENYFDFYKIEECFHIDEAELKQLYLTMGKKHHPDFFTENEFEYERAIDISSKNNVAFKNLKNFDKRVIHILELNNVLKSTENNLPPSFLMQMMDMNEAVMDLKVKPNTLKIDKVVKDVELMYTEFSHELVKLTHIADRKKDKIIRTEILGSIKDIYLKMKYVLRIQESLNTFAQQ